MLLPMAEGGTRWAKVPSHPQNSVIPRSLEKLGLLSASQSPDVSSGPGTACSEMQGAPVRAFVVPQKGAVAENTHTTGSLRS